VEKLPLKNSVEIIKSLGAYSETYVGDLVCLEQYVMGGIQYFMFHLAIIK
jgi:hypothetical protein